MTRQQGGLWCLEGLKSNRRCWQFYFAEVRHGCRIQLLHPLFSFRLSVLKVMHTSRESCSREEVSVSVLSLQGVALVTVGPAGQGIDSRLLVEFLKWSFPGRGFPVEVLFLLTLSLKVFSPGWVSLMLVSHCPEVDFRWTPKYA